MEKMRKAKMHKTVGHCFTSLPLLNEYTVFLSLILGEITLNLNLESLLWHSWIIWNPENLHGHVIYCSNVRNDHNYVRNTLANFLLKNRALCQKIISQYFRHFSIMEYWRRSQSQFSCGTKAIIDGKCANKYPPKAWIFLLFCWQIGFCAPKMQS